MGTPRLSTMISSFAPLFLVAALGTAGCAADTDEDPATGEATAAWTANPTYDAAMRQDQVSSSATPGGAFSAQTKIVGYIPRGEVDATLKKLLGVRRWTEVTDDDGSKVFSAARVIADDGRAPVRNVRANVTFPDDISLDAKLVAEKQADGSQKVTITNTTGYRHWLVGDVLQPGKLVIELKILPYKQGVIVDARARVKLETQEQRAQGITQYVEPIFHWLQQS